MGVVIPPPIREALVAHTLACLPEECCGLLAVDGHGSIRFVYPLTNVDHSPVSYTVEPREHFGALRHADRHGWEIEGGFHSHPTTTPVPSPTDVERSPGPGWLHLLVGFEAGRPAVRAFRIRDGQIEEVQEEARTQGSGRGFLRDPAHGSHQPP